MAGGIDPGVRRLARARHSAGRDGALRAVGTSGIDSAAATDPGPQPAARTVSPQIVQGSRSAGRVVARPAEYPEVAGRVGPRVGRLARSRHTIGRGGALGPVHPAGIGNLAATDPGP